MLSQNSWNGYPQSFKDMQKVARTINDVTGLKMGPAIFSVASQLLKENNKDVDATLAKIYANKSLICDLYHKTENDLNEAKKAKAAIKLNIISDTEMVSETVVSETVVLDDDNMEVDSPKNDYNNVQ